MVVICCLVAWGLIFGMSWTVAQYLLAGLIAVKQLHKIPCHNCRYFTGSWRLKCTVNPTLACSTAAICCRDYQAQSCDQGRSNLELG